MEEEVLSWRVLTMLLFISNSEKFQMLQLTMFQLWSTDIPEVSGWQQRMTPFLQKRYYRNQGFYQIVPVFYKRNLQQGILEHKQIHMAMG